MAEEQRLSFKCPNPDCGAVHSQPLSWFKDHKRFFCPFCNTEGAVDFEKLPNLKALIDELRKSQ